MTTTTATQSGKTGLRRTNRWTLEEEGCLLYLRDIQKLSYSEIAKAISEQRAFEGNIRPPVAFQAVYNKYQKLKRKQKQNESNT